VTADRLDRLRQLSVRDEASLFASHPPTGMRARLVESRPGTSATVVLTQSECDQMDQELAKSYDRAARDLIA
jgi:heat shock protein HtpX